MSLNPSPRDRLERGPTPLASRQATLLRRRTREAAALALWIGVALVLVEIAYIASAELGTRLLGPSFLAYDTSIAAAVQSLAAPSLTVVFLGLTVLGTAPSMIIQTAVFLGDLVRKRRPILASALLLTMLGEVVLEHSTKLVVQRARPDVFRLAEATGYAFPSGHALAATCLFGFVAYAYWSGWRSRGRRALLLLVGLGLPFGIGLSRIYLGVHYPSDVLGGWLGGILWLLCVRFAIRRLAKSRARLARLGG